jgi:hypothetical protein
MRQFSNVLWAAGCAALMGTVGLVAQDDALTQKARGIHERVMTLDNHDDISPNNSLPSATTRGISATRSTCPR